MHIQKLKLFSIVDWQIYRLEIKRMFKNNDKHTINPIRVHRNKFIAQMPLWDQMLHQFHELPKDRQDEILYRIYRKLFIANSKELIIQAKA